MTYREQLHDILVKNQIVDQNTAYNFCFKYDNLQTIKMMLEMSVFDLILDGKRLIDNRISNLSSILKELYGPNLKNLVYSKNTLLFRIKKL